MSLMTPLSTDLKNKFSQRFLRQSSRDMVFVSDLTFEKFNWPLNLKMNLIALF